MFLFKKISKKICEDDIECHSYEVISTAPALSLDSVDNSSHVGLIIAEMIRFRDEFDSLRRSHSASASSGGGGSGGGSDESNNYQSDMAEFWLRKTKKPVLAVLLVEKRNQSPKLYRATNMEVRKRIIIP